MAIDIFPVDFEYPPKAIEPLPLERAVFPILISSPRSAFAFLPIATDEYPNVVAFVPTATESDCAALALYPTAVAFFLFAFEELPIAIEFSSEARAPAPTATAYFFAIAYEPKAVALKSFAFALYPTAKELGCTASASSPKAMLLSSFNFDITKTLVLSTRFAGFVGSELAILNPVELAGSFSTSNNLPSRITYKLLANKTFAVQILIIIDKIFFLIKQLLVFFFIRVL